MIKSIIFDLWGTLFRTEIKPRAFWHFADKIGKNIDDYSFLKIFEKHFMLEKHYKLDVPIKALLNELKIGYSGNLIKELEKILLSDLKSQRAFPETIDVLNALKLRYKLGLISNAFYQGFDELERKFHFLRYFDVVLRSYEVKLLKPDPNIFDLMLKKLNIKKHETIMAGDSLKDDVLAAENFGIRGILIDRKNKHPEYKNRITSLSELDKFI